MQIPEAVGQRIPVSTEVRRKREEGGYSIEQVRLEREPFRYRHDSKHTDVARRLEIEWQAPRHDDAGIATKVDVPSIVGVSIGTERVAQRTALPTSRRVAAGIAAGSRTKAISTKGGDSALMRLHPAPRLGSPRCGKQAFQSPKAPLLAHEPRVTPFGVHARRVDGAALRVFGDAELLAVAAPANALFGEKVTTGEG